MWSAININLSQLLSDRLVQYFKNNLTLDNIELQKLSIGITLMFLNISKLFLIFLIGLYIGILKETVIFSALFAILRLTASGIHFKSNTACTIATLSSYLLSTYFSSKVMVPLNINIILSMICIILLYFYAPADTENRPILGAAHRKKLRIQTLIISFIFLFINIILNNRVLFNITVCALALETISVLPITYKLCNLQYNNYKKYE